MGVTRGFAGMKFSTSPRINGLISVIIVKINTIKSILKRSFTEKNGWNGIFS